MSEVDLNLLGPGELDSYCHWVECTAAEELGLVGFSRVVAEEAGKS